MAMSISTIHAGCGDGGVGGGLCIVGVTFEAVGANETEGAKDTAAGAIGETSLGGEAAGALPQVAFCFGAGELLATLAASRAAVRPCTVPFANAWQKTSYVKAFRFEL